MNIMFVKNLLGLSIRERDNRTIVFKHSSLIDNVSFSGHAINRLWNGLIGITLDFIQP